MINKYKAQKKTTARKKGRADHKLLKKGKTKDSQYFEAVSSDEL